MAFKGQYSTGQAIFTNGSATVTASGGANWSDIITGDVIAIRDGTDAEQLTFQVQTASSTTLTLTAPFTLTTRTVDYVIHRDFTSAGLPLFQPQDLQYAAIQNRIAMGFNAIAGARISTEAEALGGADNAALMTAFRTHQAFNQYGLGLTEGNANQFVGDLNTLTSEQEVYVISSGSSNLPINRNGHLKVTPTTFLNFTKQEFTAGFGARANEIRKFVRLQDASQGGWQDWQEIFNTDNASSGQNLKTVWTGSATSVGLNTLPGGYPGDGWYAVTTTGYNLKGFCFFDGGVTTGNTIYRVDGITTETIVKDGSNTVTVRNELNALQTFNLIQKVV